MAKQPLLHSLIQDAFLAWQREQGQEPSADKILIEKETAVPPRDTSQKVAK